MRTEARVSRRHFVGGLAAVLGYAGLKPEAVFAAQAATATQSRATSSRPTEAEFDAFAKLASNENPYGPPDSVMKAMTHAFKYANRYGYPDGDLVEKIAAHHGAQPENVLLGAGSGEILKTMGTTFLQGDKVVIGVEPSYSSVYRHATGLKADVITLPLLSDYSQNIPAMIESTRRNYRRVGFVYLVNPNNPTGVVVPKQDVRQLLDGIPEDVPVLIDEAYHHFVEDPSYATSVPYVLEGRPVVVARTFSKIAALAGMRVGYGIAPASLVERMRPHATGSVNALARWGAVAALADTEAQAEVKRLTLELRDKTAAELESLGFSVIPSQTNFFMVYVGRNVQEVREEFRKRGVLVGRPFPPMLQHLRVSVGSAEEMRRFMAAFKEIFSDELNPSAG
jgi:histidinol-phosphate aminotransferase